MVAKILGTKKDPFSVNALENYAMKYIFHPYISFNIRFYSITCHIKVLFGARKFFSVLFGGKSPFLSLVGPSLHSFNLCPGYRQYIQKVHIKALSISNINKQ